MSDAIRLSELGEEEEGYGLSQAAKTQIVTDIMSRFDLDRFLKEFKARDVAVIKLKKNYFHCGNYILNEPRGIVGYLSSI